MATNLAIKILDGSSGEILIQEIDHKRTTETMEMTPPGVTIETVTNTSSIQALTTVKVGPGGRDLLTGVTRDIYELQMLSIHVNPGQVPRIEKTGQGHGQLKEDMSKMRVCLLPENHRHPTEGLDQIVHMMGHPNLTRGTNFYDRKRKRRIKMLRNHSAQKIMQQKETYQSKQQINQRGFQLVVPVSSRVTACFCLLFIVE